MLVKIDELTPKDIAGICDHTFLSIPRDKEKYGKFLEEVSGFIPYGVCVRPKEVRGIRGFLNVAPLRDVKISSVAGFHEGTYSTEEKLDQAKKAIDDGADEIDFVINYDLLNRGTQPDIGKVITEVDQMGNFGRNNNIITKLILETSELSNNQIRWASEIAYKFGLDFVKTSTGYSSAGATPVHLEIMRNNFSGGVKISGGVNSQNVYRLLEAVSGRSDSQIDLDPRKVRIGESSLLRQLTDPANNPNSKGY